MVAEQHSLVAQLFAGGVDALLANVVGELAVIFKISHRVLNPDA
jgi:hypothetical protein